MATKLTNTQKHRIQELLRDGSGTKDIAKELEVPLSAITNYVETLFESLDKVKQINKKAAKEAEDKKNIKNIMITKSQNGRKGIAIMTPAASQRVDQQNEREAKKREASENRGDGGIAFRKRYAHTIYTINPDKAD